VDEMEKIKKMQQELYNLEIKIFETLKSPTLE
jgi:hypothetical protein